MKKQIIEIIRDIKEGNNLDNYLLIVIALVIAILSLIGIANQAVIASVTLTVMSLLIYGQIKSDRTLRAIRSASAIHGITSFYIDRSTISSLETSIKNSNEVAIMGLQLGAITHSYLPLLKQEAIRGCKIKLLMMSPIDQKGNIIPWVEEVGKIHTFAELDEMLRSNIVHLANWFNELPRDVRANIEIRVYCTIPTASVLLIDKDLDEGTIKVEPVLYKFSPSDRPSFVVDKESSLKLYNHLNKSFDEQWSIGIPLLKIERHIKKSK